MKFETFNFAQFSKIRGFFGKTRKKSDFKFENRENFYKGFPCKIFFQREFFVK